MEQKPSYHIRRAEDELSRSQRSDNAEAAASHRALGLLHLGRLMSSPDKEERLAAAELLERIEETGDEQPARPGTSLFSSLRAASFSRADRPMLGLRFRR